MKKILLSEQYILRIALKHFNINKRGLKKKDRKRPLPYIRFVVIYLLKKYTKLTHKEIGEIVGIKDHSSICYAIKEMNRLKDFDTFLMVNLQGMEKKLLKGNEAVKKRNERYELYLKLKEEFENGE